MSTIWTPGGEYAPRRDEPEAPAPPPGASPGGAPRDGPGAPQFTEEEMAEAGRVRNQVLATPVADIVANHAIGMFEVAALHLGAEPPKLDEARLAIDAMAAIVEGLGPRLGRHERVLRDGLSQLQMAFVEASGRVPS